MLSKTGIDRLAGVLLIAMAAALVWVQALGVDISKEGFRESLQDIADNPGSWLLAAGPLVASLVALGAAGALLLAFRPHGEALALFGALGFVGLGLTLAITSVGHAAVALMAGEYVEASGTQQADAIIAGVRPVAVASEYALFSALWAFLPVGLVSLGALIAWSGALPRWLGWLAVVSGITIPFAWLGNVADAFGLVGIIGVIVGVIWLFYTGIRLILRGTREAVAE